MSLTVGIGGVGGSGTRIVAEILIRQGIYLGATLNESNDNLIFTRNFKKPEWFETFPSQNEQLAAWYSFLEEEAFGSTSEMEEMDAAVGWGWKEPNTHIFLQVLSENVTGLRYIHVLRNGLDMAFSKNQQQANNWGRFILKDRYDGIICPRRSLDYWIAANQRAVEIGQSMGDRFLLIKYEELCNHPEREIERLLSFLGRSGKLNELKELIKPTSIGRHRYADLSEFSSEQLQSVDSLMQIDVGYNRTQTIG
jgi:hypothetical protein